MFRVTGEAGLRRGEIIALTWPSVMLDKLRIRVQASAVQIGRERRVKSTKSGRDRYVAITAHTAELLADLYAESVVKGGADASGYVWPGKGGGLMSQGSPTQALRRACVRAGLVDARGKPLVTFHGLRHTAASIMFSRGVPTATIAAQLGHADSTVTTTVYEHLVHDSHLDEAAAAFMPRTTPNSVPDTLGRTLGQSTR